MGATGAERVWTGLMGWPLDSNAIIEAVAGIPSAGRALHQATSCEWCGYSAISRLEVFGFPKLTSADERALETLLDQFDEVAITEQVITEGIRIRRLIRMKAPDAIIAASALLNQAAVVTRNVADFKGVPGLIVVDTAAL